MRKKFMALLLSALMLLNLTASVLAEGNTDLKESTSVEEAIVVEDTEQVAGEETVPEETVEEAEADKPTDKLVEPVVEQANSLWDIEDENNPVSDTSQGSREKRATTGEIEIIYHINNKNQKPGLSKNFKADFKLGADDDTGRLAGFDEGGKIVHPGHFYAGWKPYFVYADDETVFYKWDHWNTAADNSGTSFNGGQSLTKEDIEGLVVNGELELFSQYSEHDIIHVTYHKNRGDATTKDKDLLIGVDYKEEYKGKADGRLPGNTAHTEVYSGWGDATHVLKSWTTNADGTGGSFEPGSRPKKDEIKDLLDENGKLTLYAQYASPTKIKVTYDINNDKLRPNENKLRYFDLYLGASNDTGRLAGFDKEGKIVHGAHFCAGWKPYFVYTDTDTVFYKFDHWNTVADESVESGTSFNGGQSITEKDIDESLLVDGKLKLFAQYTKHDIIHVTYNENRGTTPATRDKDLLIGVDYIKEYPAKDDGRLPGKKAHTGVYSGWGDATNVLESWNTKKDGSGTKFELGSRPKKGDFSVGEKLTLYAQYAKPLPEKIKVVCYVNHDNYKDNDPVHQPATITVGAQGESGRLPGIHENGIMYHPNHFYSGNPKYFKYKLGDKIVKHVGWNTQADGKGLAFKPGQKITEKNTELSALIDDNGKLKLYSVWEIDEDAEVFIYHENGQAIGKSEWTDIKYQIIKGDKKIDVFNGINAAGTIINAFHFNGTHVGDDSGYRFVAWNTEPDGSGTWYRGGQKIPADLKEVYAQYEKKSIDTLINIANDSLTAQIYINGSKGHNSEANAFKIVKSYDDTTTKHLYYRAELIPNKEHITTLWGRLDRVEKNGDGEIHVKGKLVIEFDENLVLPETVDVSFTSGFYVPDNGELPAGTVINTNGFVNTFKYAVGEGIHSIEIPLKMVKPEKIDEMSYEEFMQPMYLTVNGKKTNKNEGIKTDIPDKEYRKIVKDHKGFIEVKGKIGTEILPIGFEKAVEFEKDVAPQFAHLALKTDITPIPVIPKPVTFYEGMNWYPYDVKINTKDITPGTSSALTVVSASDMSVMFTLLGMAVSSAVYVSKNRNK